VGEVIIGDIGVPRELVVRLGRPMPPPPPQHRRESGTATG
jgi:hypothetical protein